METTELSRVEIGDDVGADADADADDMGAESKGEGKVTETKVGESDIKAIGMKRRRRRDGNAIVVKAGE